MSSISCITQYLTPTNIYLIGGTTGIWLDEIEKFVIATDTVDAIDSGWTLLRAGGFMATVSDNTYAWTTGNWNSVNAETRIQRITFAAGAGALVDRADLIMAQYGMAGQTDKLHTNAYFAGGQGNYIINKYNFANDTVNTTYIANLASNTKTYFHGALI
jgi:hypothetical protein